MRVLLIGATGLVGGLVADRLLAHGHEVHGLVRRPTGRQGEGWHEHVAPMENWRGLVTGADAAISCLGTTRKKAGSAEKFRAVDHDAVLAFARAAREAGVPHFLSMSSVGARKESANLYLRTKGQVDEALTGIGFGALDVFRPGLLLGERAERRAGEGLAMLLDPFVRTLLRGGLRRFAGVPAEQVATAIVVALGHAQPGVRFHENDAIRRLAGAADPSS